MILIVDGVPKEGLRIQDVLIRIAVLLLIRDKVSLQVEILGSLIFLLFFLLFVSGFPFPPFPLLGLPFQRCSKQKRHDMSAFLVYAFLMHVLR
jgi:hypothetical protein